MYVQLGLGYFNKGWESLFIKKYQNKNKKYSMLLNMSYSVLITNRYFTNWISATLQLNGTSVYFFQNYW